MLTEMGNVLLTLLLAYWFVLFCKQDCVRANVINMAKDVDITMITLNCTVTTLFSGIDFTYPNKNNGHAYCIVPGISGDTQCNCSCNSTLTCKCNITQNISTKTTTLQIMDTNMTGMFGWYTCAHGSYKTSTLVTRPSLCLEQGVNDTTIKLSCTPDELKSRIDFYFPNITLGHAYCSAPSPELSNDQCNCSCNATSACKCSIIQDIATKITTLLIRDNNLTSLVGLYTCVHGPTNKSTMVATHNTSTQDYAVDIIYKTNYLIGASILGTFGLASIIWTCVYANILCRWWKKVSHYFYSKQNQKDYKRLTETDGCHMCKEFSKCGICFDCKALYCEICCKYHLKITDHRVFQTHVFPDRLTDIKCKHCIKLAERVCMVCWDTYCAPCAEGHTRHGKEKMTIIYQSQSGAKRQKTGGGTKTMNRVNNIPILGDSEPMRICGLCYLADGTVVAVDGINFKLIVFKSNDQQLQEQLEDEPCSMTAMKDNEIAVTFPYRQLIRIYKINLTTEEIIDSKDEPNIINIVCRDKRTRKPFSITYNEGFFAVEVGEGEDGMFLIIEIESKQVMKEIKSEFAYFTGHTIRLGLKMIEANNKTIDGRLFVSAISKKMVYCLDFGRVKKWHVSDPSPRSIIVPEDDSLGENIILSSRRTNTIYLLNQQNGRYKSLKVKDNLKINSPRYIAYHSKTNRLCALVVKEKKHKDETTTEDDEPPEDELNFYEFQDHEQDESSPLVDDNVEETRL